MSDVQKHDVKMTFKVITPQYYWEFLCCKYEELNEKKWIVRVNNLDTKLKWCKMLKKKSFEEISGFRDKQEDCRQKKKRKKSVLTQHVAALS